MKVPIYKTKLYLIKLIEYVSYLFEIQSKKCPINLLKVMLVIYLQMSNMPPV